MLERMAAGIGATPFARYKTRGSDSIGHGAAPVLASSAARLELEA
jgi:hypothetical protein